jgi:hypothetical protein
MALVKWSALVAEVRGKINGTVFARNRYSAFARNKVSPYNPQTARQQEVRAIFAQQSKSWRELPQEARDAWNRSVEEFLKTNIFGDTVRPSGFTLFIRININLTNIGQPTIKFPPVPVLLNTIKIIQFKLEAASKIIDITVESTEPITHTPLLFVTRPLSPGISNAHHLLRMINFSYSLVNPSQYILKVGPDYVNKFGALTDFLGQRIFFKIMPIDTKTGLNGIPIPYSSIIA